MEQDFFPLLVGRILIFVCVAISIPIYDKYGSPWWILIIGAGPFLSAGFLLYQVLKKRYIRFKFIDFNIIITLLPVVIIYIIGHSGAWVLSMGDRWLLASFNVGMEQVAYLSVAVQASLLSIFPVEMISILITPIVCNINSFNDISQGHARKSLCIMGISIIFLATIGLLGGYLYIWLFYDNIYLVNALPLYFVLMLGMFFYPFLVFARPYVTRFYSPWTIFFTEVISGMFGICVMFLLFSAWGVWGVVVGRSAGYICKSVIYLIIVQARLLLIARERRVISI